MREAQITVLMPIYKVAQFFPTALQSLIGQTYKDWCAILVDDGSPDECGDLADDAARMDGRIKVVHQRNSGVNYAMSRAMKYITTPWFALLDSDDALPTDAYAEMMKWAQEPKVDVVEGNYDRVDEEWKMGEGSTPQIWPKTHKFGLCSFNELRELALYGYVGLPFENWMRLYRTSVILYEKSCNDMKKGAIHLLLI